MIYESRALKLRKNRLKKDYGLSWDAYQAMWEGQNRKCAICFRSIKTFPSRREGGSRYEGRACVDHDHDTKIIRGLLCPKCNKGLGQFSDDPVILSRAIDYLT